MRMTDIQALADRLDALDVSDPEKAHAQADDILLESVPAEVVQAYERVVDRAGYWAHA